MAHDDDNNIKSHLLKRRLHKNQHPNHDKLESRDAKMGFGSIDDQGSSTANNKYSKNGWVDEISRPRGQKFGYASHASQASQVSHADPIDLINCQVVSNSRTKNSAKFKGRVPKLGYFKTKNNAESNWQSPKISPPSSANYNLGQKSWKAWLTGYFLFLFINTIIVGPILYITLYWATVTREQIRLPIFWNFLENKVTSSTNIRPNELSSSGTWSISLEMIVPSVPENFNLGNFMCQLLISDLNLKILRPMIVHHVSGLLQLVKTVVFIVPFLLGWKENTQTIKATLLDHKKLLVDHLVLPIDFELELSDPNIRIYDASLVLRSHLPGIRGLMRNYKLTSFMAFLGVYAWFCAIAGALIVWINLSVDDNDRAKETREIINDEQVDQDRSDNDQDKSDNDQGGLSWYDSEQIKQVMEDSLLFSRIQDIDDDNDDDNDDNNNNNSTNKNRREPTKRARDILDIENKEDQRDDEDEEDSQNLTSKNIHSVQPQQLITSVDIEYEDQDRSTIGSAGKSSLHTIPEE